MTLLLKWHKCTMLMNFLFIFSEWAINIWTVWSCKTNRKSSVLRLALSRKIGHAPVISNRGLMTALQTICMDFPSYSILFISSLALSLSASLFTYENIPDISLSKPSCLWMPCGLECACMNHRFFTALDLIK